MFLLTKEIFLEEQLTFDPIEKYGGVGENLNWKDGYAVVMQHPVTTEYKKAREHIIETLEAVNKLNYPVFWFWPNVDAGSDGTSNGIRTFREMVKPRNIHFFKNMDPLDFLRLLKHAKTLIGNSSAGIRECSYLGIPVVNIGNRQHRRLRGNNVKDVSHDRDKIFEMTEKLIKAAKYPSSNIYGNGDAGQQIADILAKIELSFSKTINY